MTIVTLLTDFGTRDYYVGAVKGVLLSLAPEARLVDIAHEIEPGSIADGAFVLASASPEFPAGSVHLGVVDPGVGGDRRILAAHNAGSFYVVPDNGLLTYCLDIRPEQWELRAVAMSSLFRKDSGSTFHGRDRFAPVAAYLAAGRPFADLGPKVTDPVRIEANPAERGSAGLSGRVVYVDRFGNAVTNIPSGWLSGSSWTARVGTLEIETVAACYDELGPARAGLVPGSRGTLEVSCRGRSAAALGSISPGDAIRVDFR